VTLTSNSHSLADHNTALQGQYIQYNSAADPNTSDNGPQNVMAIARLPSARDSDRTKTLPEGAYIDHNIVCGNDEACHDQIASTSDSVGSEFSDPEHLTAPGGWG